MLPHSVRRFSLILLMIILSACQSSVAPPPTTAPTAPSTLAPTIVQGLLPPTSTPIALAVSPTAVPTQTKVVTVGDSLLEQIQFTNQNRLKNPLPELLHIPVNFVSQINQNAYGLLAAPASLPARSSQLINESSLSQLELLQTIGMGRIRGGAFAPNTQFMVVETMLGFGVYEVPSLRQRYFVHTEAPIFRLRVSSDNRAIETLIEFNRDPSITTRWSTERYDATTGALIERLPISDTDASWDIPAIDKYQLKPPTISPDGQFEAEFDLAGTTTNVNQVRIVRHADQQLIYSGSAYNGQFSADSRYILLNDWNSLTLVSLVDGQIQSLSFPTYEQVTFSPNGQLLALDRGRQILNLEQTSIAYELPITFEPIAPFRWPKLDFSSDSSQINLGTSQWDLNSMSQLWQYSPKQIDLSLVRMATDADRQLTIEQNVVRYGWVELIVSQAGDLFSTIPLSVGNSVDIQILASQEQVVVVNEHNQVNLFELNSGKLLQTTKLNYEARALAVSPDNQMLAVAVEADNPGRICAIMLDRSSLALRQELQCHSSSEVSIMNLGYPAIQFSPDGQLLLVQSVVLADSPFNVNLVIYRVADGKALFRAKNALISPDQRLIATIDQGQLQLWGIKQ